MTVPKCPECNGDWVHDFKFNHAGWCSIGRADDGRRVADLDYMKANAVASFVRAPTPNEVKLARALGWAVTPRALIVADHAEGIDAANRPYNSIWIRGVKP